MKIMPFRRGLVPSAALLFLAAGLPSTGQENPQSALKMRGLAIERMVNSAGDETLRQFIEEHLSPELRDAFPLEEHLEQLHQIRSRCQNAANILWERLDEYGIRITFENEEGARTNLRFRIQTSPPFKIVGMAVEEGGERQRESQEPVTWETLEARLKKEEELGFSGTVLVVRDNDVVLHKGYGLAIRERGIPNSAKTVFAIGSTPIDFTKAAVLKLADLGKIRISDPITEFFAGVPEDKRSVTIENLMTGRSGLPNFHHIPGEDEDYDLTWIDRETAVGRILGQPLLFPPGTDEQHSHSAWVLLAAIVEIVSGRPYKKFLDENFFGPAGMDRTGLYQDAAAFDEDEVAVGYSPNPAGKINSPQHWGPTSWLVMGSGGMVSKPGDLYKWILSLRSGKLLSASSLEKYWSHGLLAGGNDRGFLCMYTEGPENLMILCCNSHAAMDDRAASLGRALAQLVMTKKPK